MFEAPTSSTLRFAAPYNEGFMSKLADVFIQMIIKRVKKEVFIIDGYVLR